jgi:hypothetical protein
MPKMRMKSRSRSAEERSDLAGVAKDFLLKTSLNGLRWKC